MSTFSGAPTLAATRARYREVFAAARLALLDKLDAVRPAACDCPSCDDEWQALSPAGQKTLGHPLFLEPHAGCGWDPWRQAGMAAIEREIGPQLIATMRTYETERDAVTCQHTGSCCRLASSPFDWAGLRTRAEAGDNFARQFTSIFLPYPSTETAYHRHPEDVDHVLGFGQDAVTTEAVHFYYCPHLQPDNRCGLYGMEQRPAICDSYPETPLTYVAKHCAWSPWQSQWQDRALMLHASIALCEFVMTKLRRPDGSPVGKY